MLKNQATSASSEKDNDDDQSDKGTYTIELENPNSEEVEARKMIDKDDVAWLRIQKLSRNELNILVFGEQWRHSPQAATRNDFRWKRRL